MFLKAHLTTYHSNTNIYIIACVGIRHVYINAPGDFWTRLGTIGQNPSVSKSHRLHVVIIWIFFIDLKYIP